MPFNAEIPFRAYWSTPFCKWQGSLSSLNSIEFAAWVAQQELEKRQIAVSEFDYCMLGTTVPQKHSFYGTPWLTGLLGAKGISGPTISQACATSTRVLLNATQEIESEMSACALLITADRCSNGPHLYYPDPKGPGGTGSHENWVMDSFNCDPIGRHAMLDTAENVAKKYNISTEQQHELVLMRQDQYTKATANDQIFQKGYMTLPFNIPTPNFKKIQTTLEGDEGIVPSTAEGLANLRPLLREGTVTYGGQTHPADGNAGMVVTTPEKAAQMSADSNIRIYFMGFGSGRTELAYMPEATIEASQRALKQASITIDQIDVIKSHNPFAVNDIVFARNMNIDLERMNNYGCSLIWGHPQGPTGLRSVIEMIEELVQRGGGTGLFQGCAAGDSAMALVLAVDIRS